ncbi:MAG: bifunctional UDP-sugar hydrolase/5'-nucleotidase [Clostridia bacterium]|nr:bifunctional UDP-sugar hydrolase/5'-nucleotidase [Clostridia bacterium]
MSKRLFALIMALVLAFTMSATAFADYYTGLLPAVKTIPADFTGKTIILHSNDVHGAIDGYAYIAALRDKFLSLGATDVILADAGDFSQGTIYVSTNKGETAITMMNAAHYDVVTLGNHEFDFGYAQLMQNLEKAEFTTLCCNVYLDETGETILPGWSLYETSTGLKIGFVGIETPETATKVNPGLITEINFSTFDDLYGAAQIAVDEVRAEEPDLVVALAHLGVDTESAANGYRSIDLLDKVTGIDFVIDGHSHTVMTAAEAGQPVQSTGTKFANIGVIVIDNETKAIEDNFLLATTTLAKDEEVAATAEEIMTSIDEVYNTAFATTEVLLNGEKAPGNRTEETNLGDLITDAMVWSVVKEGGIEQVEPNQVVGITNGGGIRATIEAGDVTMKDINTVLPFGNTVAVIYVTGEELLEALEASTFSTPEAIGGYPQTSGIEWVLDTTIPYDQGDVYSLNGKESSYFAPASIQRVTITAINGEAFDPAATYAVVTNNFCAAGGDTYNVFNRAYSEGSGFDTGIPMDEAVVAYITDELGGVISADMYGEPHGFATQILAEEAEEEVEPAA